MERSAFNPGIFRAYDIRGRYPDDIDEGFAERIGERIAAYLRAGTFLVGRDTRKSSAGLASAVIAGALRTGAHVLDIGEVSTPQFYWAIRSRESVGGVMVTASHLPEPNNGFKVIAHRGEVLEILGGDRLRQMYDTPSSFKGSGGVVMEESVLNGYAAAVAYAAGWQGGKELQVAIDAPVAVRRVLEKLGPIAPDAALAARCDLDGDRIMFYVHGRAIPADDIFLLLAEHFRFAPLIFDLRFSRKVRERLDQENVPYAVSRVGRLYLSLAMRERGAVFGAETSGHYFWHAMGGMESPELTLLRVLQVCGGDVQRLADLLQTYDYYAKSPEMNIPIRDRKQATSIVGYLEEKYTGCPIDRQDGLTIDCWNGCDSVPAADGFWFNIRQSHTEAVMRLVVESKKKELLDRRIQEIQKAIGIPIRQP